MMEDVHDPIASAEARGSVRASLAMLSVVAGGGVTGFMAAIATLDDIVRERRVDADFGWVDG